MARKERRDAVRVEVDGLHKTFPYVMKNRTEAEACQQMDVDVTELVEWMKRENEENGTMKCFYNQNAAMPLSSL